MSAKDQQDTASNGRHNPSQGRCNRDDPPRQLPQEPLETRLRTALENLRRERAWRDELVQMLQLDLKSPLMGLLGFLDTTLLGLEAEQPRERTVQDLRQAMEGAEQLVDRVESILQRASGPVKLR